MNCNETGSREPTPSMKGQCDTPHPSQNTDRYNASRKAIDMAFEDKKLELRDFQRGRLKELYNEVIHEYTDQAKQYPGGIGELQKTLWKIYPDLKITSDGLVWPVTIHTLVVFQWENHLDDEYGILGDKTIAMLGNKIKSKWEQGVTWKKILPPQESKNIQPTHESKLEKLSWDIMSGTDMNFSNLIAETGWKVTRKVKDFFYKHAQDISSGTLKTFLISLVPEEVKVLNSKKSKALDYILRKKLDNETITEKEIGNIMVNYFSSLDWKFTTGQQIEHDIIHQSITSEWEVRHEKEKQIKERYEVLKKNLELYHLTPEEFFAKLFIHESGGDAKDRTIKLFAASGTWSLWGCQTISRTFCNDILPEHFNPFDPKQAIPGAISFFLLENYNEGVHKLALEKAKNYAKWKPNPEQIIQDAKRGKYDVIVALDRYNKGNGWSKHNTLASMLGEGHIKHINKNPSNYSNIVMDT